MSSTGVNRDRLEDPPENAIGAHRILLQEVVKPFQGSPDLGWFALLRNPGDGTVSDPWPIFKDQNFHLQPHDFAFVDVNGCGPASIS